MHDEVNSVPIVTSSEYDYNVIFIPRFDSLMISFLGKKCITLQDLNPDTVA